MALMAFRTLYGFVFMLPVETITRRALGPRAAPGRCTLRHDINLSQMQRNRADLAIIIIKNKVGDNKANL